MKHAFVILHYLAIKDTLECVYSIKENIIYDNYKIIIVDNGSPNDSFSILEDNFSEEKNIYLIRSDENLGFANGNNLGYEFAKNELQMNSIIMINNDTIIEQPNFLSRIDEIYEESHYDILGPDIVSLKDQQHQNPYKNKTFDFTKESINNELNKRKKLKVWNKLYILQTASYLYRNYLKKFLKNYRESLRGNNQIQFDYSKRIENHKLHGSCYIFSPQFVDKFNGLYSKTFMYMEEDILYYIAQKENLYLLYDPSIRIYHKEDSSTNALLSSNRHKLDFIYKHEIHSLKEMKKMIEDDERYKEDILDKNRGAK